MTLDTSGHRVEATHAIAFGRFHVDASNSEIESVRAEAPSFMPRFLSGPIETLLLAAILGAVLIGGWIRETRPQKKWREGKLKP